MLLSNHTLIGAGQAPVRMVDSVMVDQKRLRPLCNWTGGLACQVVAQPVVFYYSCSRSLVGLHSLFSRAAKSHVKVRLLSGGPH